MRYLNLTVLILLLSSCIFGQYVPATYQFIILKRIDQEEITPKDTAYKIQILNVTKNLTELLKISQVLYYDYELRARDSTYQSSDTIHHWSIYDKTGNEDFSNYIRIHITHQSETMDVTLKYNANIVGSTRINGNLIDDGRSVNGLDTLIFTKGYFVLSERKEFNYWKELNKQSSPYSSKTIIYKGRTYTFSRQIIKLELKIKDSVLYRYDSLKVYQTAFTPYKKHYKSYCIYLDRNDVVIKGKVKRVSSDDYYDQKGVHIKRKPTITWSQMGTWYYYDSKGKLIFKSKKNNRLENQWFIMPL